MLLNGCTNFSIQASPRRPQLHKKCYCSLSSFSVLLVPFLYPDTCVSIFFSVNPLFLIYSSFPHISTFHLYLTNLPSWHLSLFTSEEGGGRGLLRYDLHCSGHFLINAANKTVAYHLIRRQQATPNEKLPLWPLFLSLQILLPTWNASESFDSSLPLLEWPSSSGSWPVASPHQYCNSSTSSLGTHKNNLIFSLLLSMS